MKIFSVVGVTPFGELIERFIETESYDVAISNFTSILSNKFNRILIKRVHPNLLIKNKKIEVNSKLVVINFEKKVYFKLKYKNLKGKYKIYYIKASSYDNAVIAFVKKRMRKSNNNLISSFSFDIFQLEKKPKNKKIIKGE